MNPSQPKRAQLLSAERRCRRLLSRRTNRIAYHRDPRAAVRIFIHPNLSVDNDLTRHLGTAGLCANHIFRPC